MSIYGYPLGYCPRPPRKLRAHMLRPNERFRTKNGDTCRALCPTVTGRIRVYVELGLNSRYDVFHPAAEILADTPEQVRAMLRRKRSFFDYFKDDTAPATTRRLVAVAHEPPTFATREFLANDGG